MIMMNMNTNKKNNLYIILLNILPISKIIKFKIIKCKIIKCKIIKCKIIKCKIIKFTIILKLITINSKYTLTIIKINNHNILINFMQEDILDNFTNKLNNLKMMKYIIN